MGKVVDMTNQQIGDVFVEYRMPNRNNVAMWMCLCKCGTHFVTEGRSLRSGNTKSCGCHNRQVAANRAINSRRDFTNVRVGSLVGQYSFVKNNRCYWHCICDCGNEVDIISGNMGRTRSCGCSKHAGLTQKNTKDLTGMIFGELTPIMRTDQKEGSNWIWLCKCSCGNYTYANTHALCSGAKKSCGCVKSEQENIISRFFDDHKIKYQREKLFINCRNKRLMPFDFYLPEYNIAIEYDGEYHYRNPYGDDLIEKQQKRDAIKTKYCEQNDIILLRIPYWEKDNIESILADWLFLYDSEEANSPTVDLSA